MEARCSGSQGAGLGVGVGASGGGCAQEEERLLWFAQLCFYLPHCCFRDWLVDEGELGLKC